jgi:hypothetical protein
MFNDETLVESETRNGREYSMVEEVEGYEVTLSTTFTDEVVQQDFIDNEDHMDVGCLSSMEGSCDLSNFDHDAFNVDEAVVLMYQKSLLFSSYGNYAAGKPPPTVRSDVEETNVVAYFKVVVKTEQGQLINRWVTKDEAIEVSSNYCSLIQILDCNYMKNYVLYSHFI